MRRTIVDQQLSSNAGDVIALDKATGHVHQWKLTPAADQRPGVRLRLVVYEETIDAAPCDERLVERARETLRARLLPIAHGVPNVALGDRIRGFAVVRDLSDAIEDLVAARIGRALRIHCDADHGDDD